MRTFKQYINKKYGEREMGKANFDCMVKKMKKYVIQNHKSNGIIDDELYNKLSAIETQKNAIKLDCGFGAVATAAGAVGSTALMMGNENDVVNGMGVAGLACSGFMLVNYIIDKKKLKESKAELKQMIEVEMAAASYPDVSYRTIDASMDETCEELVEDFVMQMHKL